MQAALKGTDSTKKILLDATLGYTQAVLTGETVYPATLMGTHAVFSEEAVCFNWGNSLPSCINGYPVLTGEAVYPAVLMGT